MTSLKRFRRLAMFSGIATGLALSIASCDNPRVAEPEASAEQDAITQVVANTSAKNAPNIVFILADDLGISDINAYAKHFTGKNPDELYYETPNMDRLASKGISFSQAYSNPLCGPTRAAIMTGRNAARVGFTTAVPLTKTYFNQGITTPEGNSPHDAIYHMDRIKEQQAWMNGSTNTALDPDLTILPEVLDSHHSAFIGKWHLGGLGVKDLQPVPQGFDEVPASLDFGGSQYHYDANPKSPRYAWPVGWDTETPHYNTMPKGAFDIGTAGKPPHADYLTDDLTDRAVDFIKRRHSDTSENKKPFFLYLAHFAVHTPFHAPKGLIPYYENKAQRGTLGHSNATYAAMVSRLDASIGRIMDTLEDLGLDKNTMIVLTSDNGGTEYTNPAATDNQPFRGGKATMYEGGVRVPLIVYMPDKFEGGTWRDQVVTSVDHMPTLAALTGNELPEGTDGQNFIPVLEDANADMGERTLIWHYPYNVIVRHPNHDLPLTPTSGMRKGDYKLIWDWHGKLELYNVVKDPFEYNDLADNMSQKTDDMFNELHSWLLTNVNAKYMPYRNKDYDESKDTRSYPFKDLSGELTQ